MTLEELMTAVDREHANALDVLLSERQTEIARLMLLVADYRSRWEVAGVQLADARRLLQASQAECRRVAAALEAARAGEEQ